MHTFAAFIPLILLLTPSNRHSALNLGIESTFQIPPRNCLDAYPAWFSLTPDQLQRTASAAMCKPNFTCTRFAHVRLRSRPKRVTRVLGTGDSSTHGFGDHRFKVRKPFFFHTPSLNAPKAALSSLSPHYSGRDSADYVSVFELPDRPFSDLCPLKNRDWLIDFLRSSPEQGIMCMVDGYHWEKP